MTKRFAPVPHGRLGVCAVSESRKPSNTPVQFSISNITAELIVARGWWDAERSHHVPLQEQAAHHLEVTPKGESRG
jgi:hypothetical protein